jgi:hypothetical protein
VGQGRCLRQCPLAGRFAGAIDIEDETALAGAIPEPANRLRRPAPGERGGDKQSSQRVHAWAIHRREKATQRGAMGQRSPLKQGHERGGKGREPLEVRLEGPFATDGVAKQERQKVQDLILAEPTAHQAHPLRHGREQSMCAQVLRQQDRFGEPGGHRGLGGSGGLYLQTGMGYGGHGSLQRDTLMTVPSQRRLLFLLHSELSSLPHPHLDLVAHLVGTPSASHIPQVRLLILDICAGQAVPTLNCPVA